MKFSKILSVLFLATTMFGCLIQARSVGQELNFETVGSKCCGCNKCCGCFKCC